MNILRQTTAKPTPQPSAGPAPTKPAPARVSFDDMQPKTPAQEFGAALVAAGWGFDIGAVALVNGRKTAKLDSLKFAFVDFLAARKHYPGPDRLEQMTQTLESDVLKLLPRVGGLL